MLLSEQFDKVISFSNVKPAPSFATQIFKRSQTLDKHTPNSFSIEKRRFLYLLFLLVK